MSLQLKAQMLGVYPFWEDLLLVSSFFERTRFTWI